MLEFGIVGKDYIKSFTEILYQLVGKSNSYMSPLFFVKATYDGLVVEQMEQSGSVFTIISIGRHFFQRYKFSEEQDFKFNAKDLVDRLRLITSDVEAIDLMVDKKYLNVIFGTENGAAASYRLNLHELDEDDRRDIGEKARSIPLNARLELKSKSDIAKFLSAYKNAQIYDKSQKHLKFTINNIGGSGLISFSTQQPDRSFAEVKAVFGNNQVDVDMDDVVEANYDDDYLSKFLTLISNKTSFARLKHLFKALNIEMGNESPLRIELDLDSINVMFLMAPLELGDDNEDDYDYDDEEDDEEEEVVELPTIIEN